jgi:hypothetical protein
MEVNNLHEIMGHCGGASVRLTGKALSYEVIGAFDTCEAFSICKAKQKNINEHWKGGNSISWEILYVDISLVQGVRDVDWQIFVFLTRTLGVFFPEKDGIRAVWWTHDDKE